MKATITQYADRVEIVIVSRRSGRKSPTKTRRQVEQSGLRADGRRGARTRARVPRRVPELVQLRFW